MTVKEFVKKYNTMARENLKDDLINEEIKFISYLPFIKKDVLAEKLINSSMYEYENYANKLFGKSNTKKTDRIKINSVVQYLLFCRIVIENYTDLQIETEGFYEEYDLLRQSGLLDKIMLSGKYIPENELDELRMIIDLKQKDFINNYINPQRYISNQIEKISTVLGITLKPILENIVKQMNQHNDGGFENMGE